MRPERSTRILRLASVLALAALGLMLWSLFDPGPRSILIALSVGQALGTASFVAFVFVGAMDVRRRLRGRRELEDQSRE